MKAKTLALVTPTYRAAWRQFTGYAAHRIQAHLPASLGSNIEAYQKSMLWG